MDLIEISYNTSMKISEITYILIKSQRLSNPSKVKSKEGKIQTGKGPGKGPGPRGGSRSKEKGPSMANLQKDSQGCTLIPLPCTAVPRVN